MTTRHILLGLAALLATGAVVDGAVAHIKLTSPAARYVYTNSGQKTGPCGGGTATGEVTALKAGESITVTWEETINHPGHYRVALDLDGGDDFPDPVSEKDKDVKGNVVAYVDDAGGKQFSHTFTVPNVACAKCSLQVLQVMTDKLPWGPANGDDLYFWCADVSIEAQDPTTGAGGMTGAGGEGAGGEGAAASTGATAGAGTGGATSGAGGDDGSTGAGKTITIGSANDDSSCRVAGPGRQGDDRLAYTFALAALGVTARRRRRDAV